MKKRRLEKENNQESKRKVADVPTLREKEAGEDEDQDMGVSRTSSSSRSRSTLVSPTTPADAQAPRAGDKRQLDDEVPQDRKKVRLEELSEGPGAQKAARGGRNAPREGQKGALEAQNGAPEAQKGPPNQMYSNTSEF